MKGKCLCGQVEFEVTGKLSNLYQCHCSLCQKATGSSSCSSLIMGVNEVSWIKGKDKVSSFTRENGFRTDFCSSCGSPVPNKMNIGDYMWVPAGLLEGQAEIGIAAHIHTASRASWEKNTENCTRLSGGPNNIDEFVKSLSEF